MERLNALKITDPLPIQRAALPHALAGRDVCGQAPTGSGKTLAFAIPLVAGASPRPEPLAPTGLVLVPTRELAEQVHSVLCSLFGPRKGRVAAIYGGVGYGQQRAALRRGVQVVVACPGRLEDLIAQGDVRLDRVRLLVLDEADRMVDMGFLRPVRRIVDQTAADRQVLLFSATMGPEVEAISRRYQHQPHRCVVEADAPGPGSVTHLFWRTERPERVAVTARLVVRHGQAFVFCRTKRGADRVARQLRSAGVAAAAMHGDLSQAQRTRALASFSAGDTHALVATDVVARGIHVEGVPCVVHFDPADGPEAYLHRSGRTGRAGNTGTVVSLVPGESPAEVRALQRALGLEATTELPFSDDGPTGIRPAREAASQRRSERPHRARQSPGHPTASTPNTARRRRTRRPVR